MNLLHEPVIQVALPIVITIIISTMVNNKAIDAINKRLDDAVLGINKRLDDTSLGINKRLDDIVARLGRIEIKVDDHSTRITRLEERTSPLSRH